jgi:hypothetical protein
MFNFKKGISKEIFITALILMVVIAVILSQARYSSRRKKPNSPNIFTILDQGVPMDPSTPSINLDLETRRKEVLDEINQTLETIENPNPTNSSFTLKEYDNFLASHVGKRVVLLFWADWNRFSTNTLEQLALLSSDPSVSTVAIHQGKLNPTTSSLISEKKYDFSIIEDTSGVLFQKHQVFLIPTTLFLDTNHNLSRSLDGGISLQQMLETLRSVQ